MTNSIIQKTKTLIMYKATNYTLMFLVLMLVVAYVYFANMAVRTLTVLEKTKQQMQTLNIEVSELESTRLAMENNINMNKVLGLGFVEVENPIFIIKSAKKTALSLKID